MLLKMKRTYFVVSNDLLHQVIGRGFFGNRKITSPPLLARKVLLEDLRHTTTHPIPTLFCFPTPRKATNESKRTKMAAHEIREAVKNVLADFVR